MESPSRPLGDISSAAARPYLTACLALSLGVDVDRCLINTGEGVVPGIVSVVSQGGGGHIWLSYTKRVAVKSVPSIPPFKMNTLLFEIVYFKSSCLDSNSTSKSL